MISVKPASPLDTSDAAGVENGAPPAPPSSFVSRDRLLGLLDLAVEQRLTRVVAPIGYGKTALLAQWAASRPAGRIRWLGLSEHHDDRRRFAAALRGALGIRTLGVELAAIGPITLVIDDLHLLSDDVLVDELGRILRAAPPSLHVVVGSRHVPPLALCRPWLSSAGVDLRQEGLALTVDEAVQLFAAVGARDVSRSRIEVLVERTEGWAAGLSMAAHASRTGSLGCGGDAALAGFEERVQRYFAACVLRSQPASVRRFLLQTSVLRRMDGPSCDAVTGGEGSDAMLDELERRSLFVARAGEAGDRRYHRLFGALLRQRLRDEDARAEAQLLRRAAAWHLGRDEIESGVEYLVEAGANAAALDVASSTAGVLLAQGRVMALVDWLDRVLPTDGVGRADGHVLRAAALIFGGDCRRVEGDLDAADAAAGSSVGVRVVSQLLRGYAALQRGDAAGAERHAAGVLGAIEAEVIELPDVLGLTTGRTDVLAVARLTKGSALLLQGRWPEARAHLDVPEEAHPMWQILATGALALLEAWCGRFRLAEELSRRALALASQVPVAQQACVAAQLALAHVLRERGEFEAAGAGLGTAEHQLNARDEVGARVIAVERALLALAERRRDIGGLAAEDPRAEGAPVVAARRQTVVGLSLLEAGDVEGAARVLHAPAEVVTAELRAARVRVAFERRDLGAARRLVAAWPSHGESRSQRSRGLWEVVLHDAAGDRAAALERLAAVVADAERERDVGVFRAAHDHVLPAARALYFAAPSPFLRAVVERPPRTAVSGVSLGTAVPSALTRREQAILAALPVLASNQDIADRLAISPNTLKTHLKHIYRKLDVTCRSDAVVEAERLRLL